jgi:hypothetical protein
MTFPPFLSGERQRGFSTYGPLVWAQLSVLLPAHFAATRESRMERQTETVSRNAVCDDGRAYDQWRSIVLTISLTLTTPRRPA